MVYGRGYGGPLPAPIRPLPGDLLKDRGPLPICDPMSTTQESQHTASDMTAPGDAEAESQLLVIRAASRSWALPVANVEQVFELGSCQVHNVGETKVVEFRGQTLELINLAQHLGLEAGEPQAAVAIWAAGRPLALAVDELVDQVTTARVAMPTLARGALSRDLIVHEDELIPVIEPSALITGSEDALDVLRGFTEMQQSALIEVANIGSGHAATALSTMLGRPVDVGFSKATLTALAQAVDEAGPAMGRSALVITPLHDGNGQMLLILPEDTAEELCQLLGTTMSDPVGLTALQEVGNILSSSYMNAIVELTGLELEPDPPSVNVDLLGRLLNSSGVADTDPTDPTVLMRSYLTIEGTQARFTFLFVPHLNSVERLLESLGLGR